MTIFDAIEKHAIDNPEKLAVADYNISYSYYDLLSAIRGVAEFLKKEGIKRQDIIAIKAYQNAEFVILLLGIQYYGAIACPIENSAKDERILQVLDEISTSFYIDRNELLGDAVSQYTYSGILDFVKCESSNDESLKGCNDESLYSDIIYTTGTTGKSKGILVTYKTNVAIAENVVDSVKMTENDVELITTSTSHSLALRRLYAAMWIGSSAVFTDNFIMYDKFYKLFSEYSITAITFVPAILNIVMETAKDKLRALDSQLNYVQIGSAPLHEEQMQRLISMLPTTRLYNTYGATESGCTIALEFSKYNNKNCIGATTVNTELIFLNDEGVSVKSHDEKTAGLMAFKGEMNMSGYINDPDMTAEVLKDGIIYTNDYGYLGQDGLVYLLGRKGETINCGGLKINPTEVEEAALEYDDVTDCACAPMPDKMLGEAPRLFITTNNEDISVKELKEFIAKKLESYKVPKSIEIIDSIPRTFNGKIIRRELINLK